MKRIIVIFFLCITLSGFTQSKVDSLLLTKTEWVNSDLTYLRFFKDSVVYNIDNAKHALIFDFKNRKLTFKEKYFVGGTDSREENIDFKIKYLNKNKLVIVPVTKKEELAEKNYKKLNSEPFFKEKQYIFYNRGQLISKIDFNKITFHASTCFGTCKSMSVEVNNDGSVYYQGRIYTKEFTGNFEGKLNSKDLNQLKHIINRSQLKVLDQQWKQLSRPNDTPRYNYIVELTDGKLIEINTNDQHPILDRLSEYFLNIHETAELTKATKKHQFSESNIDNYKVTQN